MNSSAYLIERATLIAKLKELDDKLLIEWSDEKENNIRKVVELMSTLNVTTEDMIQRFAQEHLNFHKNQDSAIRDILQAQ